MPVDPRRSAKLAVCLATIYLVWGSSFLFSKVAVDNLPIALLAGVRFVTAGTVLAIVARYWTRVPWPQYLADWRHVAIAGFFMVFASNGLNVWALQFLPSNESALLNASAAIWITGLGVFGRRGHPLNRRAAFRVAVGLLGTGLMLVPRAAPSGSLLLAKFGVLLACFCWALGTIYYRSIDTRLSPLMFMALQMLFGGLLLLGVGFASGESARWTINAAGLISLSYLTFVSSCLAYTAYGWLALNAAPALIGTYSYVNPAIAAFLGWQFLHESLSRLQVAGMIIIIVGVMLMTLRGGGFADGKIRREANAR